MLRIDDRELKRFRRPARNQERLLTSFESQGWPSRIENPFSKNNSETLPADQLRDTVKRLNATIDRRLLHFHTDGTGHGVCWETDLEWPETG